MPKAKKFFTNNEKKKKRGKTLSYERVKGDKRRLGRQPKRRME